MLPETVLGTLQLQAVANISQNMVAITIIIGILRASTGALEGRKDGERFDYVRFIKTVLVYIAGAGLISQASARTLEELLALLGGNTFMWFLVDKIIDHLITPWTTKRTSLTAPPTP